MARRVRIQFPGARYHVINRGNYRCDVFASVGAARAFGLALDEAAHRHGWRVHAHVTMRNHFHLALETPEPNLVEGMHWLLGTFANRFNRYRNERGHLFQGRYHAFLVEDDAHLVRLINYIHLNPVRAGIVKVEQLSQFRRSSLRALLRGPRAAWLTADVVLSHLGLTDGADGWRRYLNLLSELARTPTPDLSVAPDPFASGWAIGSPTWQSSMSERHVALATKPGVPADEIRAFKEARWRQELAAALNDAGKSADDLAHAPKGAAWKVAIAQRLRRHVAAPHAWIASALNLGAASSVRSYVCREINK